MRRVSLNARTFYDDLSSEEVHVALFHIEHESLDAPVRLSTDPTERLSADPLAYGTRSTWLGANPLEEPFFFILASTILPSDLDDAPASGNIVIENVHQDIVKVVRSFTSFATVHMAVVLASSPDEIEAEWRDMKIMSADIDSGEIVLQFSRDDIEDEYSPSGRMTKNWFPALYG